MKMYKYVIAIFLMFFNISCDKFLDVGDPQDKIVARYVYRSNTSAAAAMTGVYYDLVQKTSFSQGVSGVSISCGAAADELTVYPTSGLMNFYTNYIDIGSGGGFWASLYKFIYKVNAIIDGVTRSTTLSDNVKRHLLGEAKFVRAFCYFYLVNLYGDVPLLITADYRENQSSPRVSVAQVYKQILSDLNEAKLLLSEEYLDANVISTTYERLRPNKWAAAALLARVYLYIGDWENAINESNDVINNKELYDTVPLSDVFLKNSKESIWQLQPMYNNPDATYYGTFDARVFVLERDPNERENPAWISDFLINAFESGDNRLNTWVRRYSSATQVYNYPFKYRQNKLEGDKSEYLSVIRLSELYLIRSEAKAVLGLLEDAKSDLNIIRRRAGLQPILVNNADLILDRILHERQVELFAEWGHRWMDLKRNKLVDGVMMKVSPKKGSEWSSYRALFPIPERDLRLNPSLKQNQGY
ncbi:RagB/SusD family nutrient uptake outer membrane protein [Chitinophaga agri]|uniref:RagB/SusD family nutrient uptake outer membrane protein n=1 Tax=Chitinophaga agri TaxID=2703787 RepID=A0A6B9ZG60_9BACT|nr:RagB/SusD family nutrient uptake outer membrane protein [Chitinophaga agri]QHS61046.1 RagB/SusD family nutrient uptake outer membrane protein [Chitinophaga agri]